MGDEELEDLLREVETVAKSTGLGSLVEQEQAMARSGQTTEFASAAGNGRPTAGLPSYSPRKGEFRIMPLGVRQRLATILDLIEAAVVGGNLVEEDVQGYATELVEMNLLASKEVTFDVPSESPDVLSGESGDAATQTERKAWALQDNRSPGRQDAIRAVVDTIRQLRSRANLERGDWLVEVTGERRSGTGWSM